MEDISLDEFTDATDESESGDSSNADSNSVHETEPENGTVAPSEVEPATVTSGWVENGKECSNCSETATRLWNDDGQFVCGSCKDW
jgi:formylmethanofuran dehydrogenase subunit E